MLAFFGNLSGFELLLVVAIAILVFGRRLPEVAAHGAQRLIRLRRSMEAMWRDTGLSQEWRSLQREVDQVRRFDPLAPPPPPRRGGPPPVLPDQRAAQEAADLAARQAPEVPWSRPEVGPPAEEARREGAEGRGGREPEGAAHDPWPDAEADRADSAAEGGAVPDPDSDAPQGSVPRS